MMCMRFASCATLQHISCAYVRVRVCFVCVRAVRVLRMCVCCARFASHCNTYRVRVCTCACARFLCVCACCASENMCVCARAFHVHQLYTQLLQHAAIYCNTLQHRMTFDVCVPCVCASPVHEHVQDTTMPMCCSVFGSCCSETQITHTSYVIQIFSVL